MLALVGSNTRHAPHVKGFNGKGISVYAFDPETSALDLLHVQGGIDSPCFLAPHPHQAIVYAATEVFDWNEGTLSAYRLDPASSRLAYINKQAAHGNSTCFCDLDRSGRFVVVANYSAGAPADEPRCAFAVFPLRDDGGLKPASATIQLHGTGPNAARQEQPHGHWIGFSPDNRYLLAIDLGTDRLLSWPFDAETGAVAQTDEQVCTLPGGSGPRHLVFHPSGRVAFVSLEMGSGVATLDFDGGRGAFHMRDVASSLPSGWSDPNTASDLQLTPSGRTLIVANRGHDGVSVFRCASDGGLTPTQHVSGHGQTPRHLQVDPTGRWLFAAYQDSDALGIYAIDDEAASLRFHRIEPCGSPMCVRFR